MQSRNKPNLLFKAVNYTRVREMSRYVF